MLVGISSSGISVWGSGAAGGGDGGDVGRDGDGAGAPLPLFRRLGQFAIDSISLLRNSSADGTSGGGGAGEGSSVPVPLGDGDGGGDGGDVGRDGDSDGTIQILNLAQSGLFSNVGSYESLLVP